MKQVLLVVLLSFLSPYLSRAQDKVIPEFERDVAALESGLTDSLGFDRIIKKIESTLNQPRLSLRYVAFFDKMHARFPSIPKDTLMVKSLQCTIYRNLAWNSQNTDVDLALRQLDTAEMMAEAAGYTPGLLRIKYGRGVVYRIEGDYERALSYFDQFLSHFLKPYDSTSVANVQYQIGICLLELGRIEESIKAFNITAELDEALDRNVYAYNMLGKAYRKAKLFTKSEAFYLKAYEHWKEKENIDGQSRALMNLGNLKMELGERDAAKQLFLRSVALDQSNDYALAYSSENLGDWYLKAEQYDSAYHYTLQSYRLRQAFNNSRELAMIEHQLGRVHMAREQYRLALPFLQRAFATAEKQGEQERIRDVAADLSRWYEDQGNYREALRYKETFITAKDSLLNESIARAVADVSEKYETEQKEETIEQLNTQNRLQASLLQARQRQLLIVLVGATLLIGLLFGIYRLYRQLKLQNQFIEKNLREKEILLKEIHHRVKNNLQVIASLLRIQSRSITDEQAKQALLDGRSRVRSMALIHEDLYQENNLSGIFMPDYLGKLAHDIFRIYNVASDRIRLQTAIAPLRLDVDTVIPIGLIVNELITNALKHAFPEYRSGVVTLSLQEQTGTLVLEVCDNGLGIQEAATEGAYGLSMIEIFREKLEGELYITADGGTSVRLSIKKYQKLEPVTG